MGGHDDTQGQPRRFLIMAALILAEIVSTFEGSMIYAALKSFYTIFDDPIGVGWLLTGYMLVASVSAALFGRLGDMFGRKRLMLIALGFSFVGSLLSAATDDLGWIITGRAMQGSAGAILPLCYGIVRENMPKASVPLNIGIIAATVAGGAGIGMVLGGYLVDHGSWRYIFLVSAGVAALAFIAILLIVPAGQQHRPGRIDWIGGALFLPGLSLMLYALGVADKAGWGDPQVLSLTGVGAVLLGLWFLWEYRHPEPLIDVRLMISPQIGLTLLIWSLLAVGAANMPQVVMVMLQQSPATGVGLGLSATAAGSLNAPASVLGIAAGPLVGWFAARRGARLATIIAAGCVLIGWTGLFFAHDSVGIMAIWIIINAVGMGAAFACIPNLIVEVAPEHRTSEATGLAQIVRKVMSGVGTQIIAVTLASSTIATVQGGQFPDSSAYALTYGWIALASAIALLFAFALPKRGRISQERIV